MNSRLENNRGFTIVELLIVIVVIGILAAISIVAYNGIQDRAKTAALTADLAQSAKSLEVAKLSDSSDKYPVDLASAGLKTSNGSTYKYSYGVSDNSYCLTASNGSLSTAVSSGNPTVTLGDCASSNLLGWWPLNGNGTDKSSAGHDGTVTAATPTSGQNGQTNAAYGFNGTTSTIFTTLATVGSSNVTVSGWAQVQPGTTKGSIVHVGGGDGYTIGLGSYLSTTNSVVTVLFPGTRWILTPATVAAGWHLFTLVLGTDGTPSIFIDGISIGRYPGQNAATPTAQLSIGRNLGDEPIGQAERTFNGSIDDVRLYGRALDVAEVQALFLAGAQ